MEKKKVLLMSRVNDFKRIYSGERSGLEIARTSAVLLRNLYIYNYG